MKSFFNHTLLILAVLAVCSLAILFRSQLLAGYERTQLSVPAEEIPVKTVPVPASIRSNAKESVPKTTFQYPKPQDKNTWKASNLSDFADAPGDVRKRIKANIEGQ